MLFSLEETCQMISSGKLLHIAGTEDLLKKLPKGNWIGGSTEYFMTKFGGVVTGDALFVTQLPYDIFTIIEYDETNIASITVDAFDNGFSIVVLPFDSAIHKIYAREAPNFEGMFIKNITGWVSGSNLGVPGQTPIAVNGQTGASFTSKAVVVHIRVPDDKLVHIDIVNIFSPDETSPAIEFTEEGFSAKTCKINGKETIFADYLAENKIDTRFPLIGEYSGTGINTSFKSVEGGVVTFYAPVFPGITYKIAKNVSNYVDEFINRLKARDDAKVTFACNCILNFLYGELEGKDIGSFFGPITFGEIAFQLVNQTLVYVSVTQRN